MATKKTERAVTFEHVGTVLTFNVANVGVLKLDLEKTSQQANDMAVVFGFARKVVNAAALEAGSTNQEKFDAMSAVVEHLNGGGDWNIGRKGGEGFGADSLVVLALMRVYGDTKEKAEATITRTMDKKRLDRKAALKLWAGTDKIAAAIVAIKTERATKAAESAKVSADDLIDEMGE